MKVKLKVEGLKGVDAALSELIEATSSRTGKAALKRGLVKAAEPMAERMRQLAPARSGKLRKAIQVTTRIEDAGAKAAYAKAIGAKVIGKLSQDERKANAAAAVRQYHRENRGKTSTVEVEIGIAKEKKGGGSLARHAHLVEFGSKPHVIRPRKEGGKGLKIYGGSPPTLQAVVPKVEHPGARPHPFMRPGFQQGAPLAAEAVKASVTEEISKAARRAKARSGRLKG